LVFEDFCSPDVFSALVVLGIQHSNPAPKHSSRLENQWDPPAESTQILPIIANFWLKCPFLPHLLTGYVAGASVLDPPYCPKSAFNTPLKPFKEQSEKNVKKTEKICEFGELPIDIPL